MKMFKNDPKHKNFKCIACFLTSGYDWSHQSIGLEIATELTGPMFLGLDLDLTPDGESWIQVRVYGSMSRKTKNVRCDEILGLVLRTEVTLVKGLNVLARVPVGL